MLDITFWGEGLDTIHLCNLYPFFFWCRYSLAFAWDIFRRLHGDFTAHFSLMCVYSISAMEIIGKCCLKALLIIYTIAGTTWLFVVMLKPLVRTGLLEKESLWET